ncbi:MAG: PQQ-binding-like beta-propeller repeat protein [Chitinophagaceae bacterium]
MKLIHEFELSVLLITYVVVLCIDQFHLSIIMKSKKSWLIAIIYQKSFCILFLFIISCNKDMSDSEADRIKEIVSFSLKRNNGIAFDTSEVKVTFKPDTIMILLPAGTTITNLIPEIVIKGQSIQPASGVAQNFELPVRYTVVGQDGSTKEYVVIVTFGPLSGSIFFGSSDNNFYALDIKTGFLKWKFSGTHSFAYSSATYKEGIVYVGGIDSYVYAFNATNGTIIWRYKAGDTGIESDAVIVDSTVYVGSNDDNLYAINAADGTLRWKFTTGANVSASPLVWNGVVYFGSSDNKLYALNATTGSLIWQYRTGAMINQSGPCLVNGIIYVGSRDAYLHAVDAITGIQKWKYSTNGISLEQSSPTVADGIVYIGGWYDIATFTSKGSVYAINAGTGILLWEGLANKAFSSSPFIRNGRLFIGCDDGYINALNISNGSLLWQKKILPNSSSPVEANGIVYIGGGGTRYYYALDAATGDEVWKFPLPNGLMASSPLLLDDSGIIGYSGDSGVKQ